VRIDDVFDSGRIRVVDASDPGDVRLALRPDPPTETTDGVRHYAQWFHFCVSGVRGVPLSIRIDVSKAAYPDGWSGYRAVASTDREDWVRVDTTFAEGELRLRLVPEGDVVWIAYFAPYDLTRVAAVVGRAARAPGVALRPVGTTLDGRVLDRLVVGEGTGPVLWVIARQHPGEAMASWWMEGFLDRLLDPHDALAVSLRERAVLHVVPHMNPDGSFRGHLRTNAAGTDLNRAWGAPSPERSPEVLATRNAMDEARPSLCLDVHGDEGLPYNFIAGANGIPDWTPRLASLQDRFKAAYERANPHFQRVHGYKVDEPGQANLAMCTAAVAQRYGALAMTLEMPFKDDANHPDPRGGWSPARSMRLGRSAIDALAAVVDDLR
jgi:murein tripeptide amidase MpaA